MKGCLEALCIVLLGAGVAAWLVWDAQRAPGMPAPAGAAAPVDAAGVKAEFEMLKRQFQTTANYEQRLAAQHLTEAELKSRIASALAQQQGLERARPQVSDAEARAWYERHRESLRIPETYHAAHVFLTRHDSSKPDRQAEIEAVHGQLVERKLTFREAAAKFSEDDRTKALAGDLGWFSADRMPPDFIAAVQALQPGQTSQPVLTRLGWHVIHLMERRPSRLPAFEEARAEILAALEAHILASDL